METGSNSYHNHQEDGGGKNNPGTRSWGTAALGQSVSTSGSVSSPSSRSEHASLAMPTGHSIFLQLNNLDIQGDGTGSQGVAGAIHLSHLLLGDTEGISSSLHVLQSVICRKKFMVY